MRKGSLALLVLFATGALAAPVELKVSLRVGDSPLRFDQTYQTPQGLRYQIDLLKFYISNVALIRPDGREVKVEGLTLADFKRGAPTQGVSVMRMDLPPGQYRGLRFDMGVPRELNHLDAGTQQLPLGVNSGMYWAWNPGYIFYRLEGTALLPEGKQKWVIHMGTDAFRIPVRLHDLQTRRVQINIPPGGGVINVHLDVARAFQTGPGGVFLDWRKQSLRQLHGLSPETSLMMSVVYFNMLSAFSLAQ